MRNTDYRDLIILLLSFTNMIHSILYYGTLNIIASTIAFSVCFVFIIRDEYLKRKDK